MTKEKKKTIIFTAVLVIVLILISAVLIFLSLRKSGIVGSSDSNEVMKEFNKHFNSDEKMIIYYASPSCHYCNLQTPILETIAEDYDVEYYYLDSSKLSNRQRKEVLKKLDQDSHATPTTVVVENGKVIDSAVGYTAGKEYVEFFIETGVLEEGSVYSKEKYITYISYDEYDEIINDDEVNIVVIGQTTCSHCIAIKPALNSVAEDYNLTINYLNLTDMTKDESNSFFKSLEQLEYSDPEFLQSGKIGTPLTLIIENGKISNYISGERTTSQLVREFRKFGLIEE